MKDNRLEVVLDLAIGAFKQSAKQAEAAVRGMAGQMGNSLGQTRQRWRDNIAAVADYRLELNRQVGVLDTLGGKVAALAGAYLGLRSALQIKDILMAADSAAFTLTASLQAANREFANVGSLDSWGSSIEALSTKLHIYSKTELQNAAAATVDMTKRLGLSEAQMVTLIERTGDLSAGKFSLQDGLTRVTAAMRGEAEASEALGLTLGETYIRTWYEAQGATQGAWKELDELQKAQVRYQAFLAQAEPATGKAADSVKTLAGAFQLARKEINDAVSENPSAVAAMKELAAVVSENSESLGELVATVVGAAAAVARFVLEHKDAIVTLAAVAAGAAALTVVITTLTKAWAALNLVMLGTVGAKIIPWLLSFGLQLKALGAAIPGVLAKIGAFSGAITAVGGAFGLLLPAIVVVITALASWQVGKVLGKFAPIKQAALDLVYVFDRLRLAAQKMWAIVTGGDVGAVDGKIGAAKQAYKDLSNDIATGKDEVKKAAEEEPVKVVDEEAVEKQVETAQVAAEKSTAAAAEVIEDKKELPTEKSKEEKTAAQAAHDAEDAFFGRKTEMRDLEQEAIDSRPANQLTDEQLAERQKRLGRTESTEEAIQKAEKEKEEKETAHQEDLAKEKEKQAAIAENAAKKDRAARDRRLKEAAAELEARNAEAKARQDKQKQDEEAEKSASKSNAEKPLQKVSSSGQFSLHGDALTEEEWGKLTAEDKKILQQQAAKGGKAYDYFNNKTGSRFKGDTTQSLKEAQAAKAKALLAERLFQEEHNKKFQALLEKQVQDQIDFENSTNDFLKRNKARRIQQEQEFSEKLKKIHEKRNADNEALALKRRGGRVIGQYDESAGKDEANKWAETQRSSVEKAKSIFQQYGDRVRTIQEEILNREKKLAEQLAGMHQQNTGDDWRQKARAAYEYEQAAKKAMAAGNLDEAQSLADRSQEMYQGLRGKDAAGDRLAYSGTKSAGGLGIDVARAMQQAAADAARTSLAGKDLFGGLSATISRQLAAIAAGTSSGGDTAGSPRQPAAKVHELRFAGGSMRGAETDVDALLNLLAKAGMTTA